MSSRYHSRSPPRNYQGAPPPYSQDPPPYFTPHSRPNSPVYDPHSLNYPRGVPMSPSETGSFHAQSNSMDLESEYLAAIKQLANDKYRYSEGGKLCREFIWPDESPNMMAMIIGAKNEFWGKERNMLKIGQYSLDRYTLPHFQNAPEDVKDDYYHAMVNLANMKIEQYEHDGKLRYEIIWPDKSANMITANRRNFWKRKFSKVKSLFQYMTPHRNFEELVATR